MALRSGLELAIPGAHPGAIQAIEVSASSWLITDDLNAYSSDFASSNESGTPVAHFAAAMGSLIDKSAYERLTGFSTS